MLSRRDFFRTSLGSFTLLALAPTVPAFLANTARAARRDRDGRALVVLQLDGGNDGINTVVPFRDEGYARNRKHLRLPGDRLVKVSESVGLHPALRDTGQLLEAGHLAFVQGVGYPNPSRSHFESMKIWHSAQREPGRRDGRGWLGRGLDADPRRKAREPDALFLGAGRLPEALSARRAIAAGLERPEDLALPSGIDYKAAIVGASSGDDLLAFVRRSALDAYSTGERLAALARKGAGGGYPNALLGTHLRLVARLIQAGLGARVYYVRQAGYDTHAAQAGRHADLLSDLSRSLKAFLDELTEARLAERVVVLAFSEFGRTVRENGSAGTDHGTAGPVLLAGPAVKSGLLGETPNLTDLDPEHGDLKVGIDFRRVYGSVLEGWLGLSAEAALGHKYAPFPLFRTARGVKE